MMTIGDRVRKLREEKGLRPEVLAVALNVSANTIRKLEKNEGGIRAERLVPLARVLGVSTDYLLGMDEKSVSKSEMVGSGAL